MNKRELLKEIKGVMQGDSGAQWIAVAKKGRGWEIVGSGLGRPLRENFDDEDMLFRHVCNECTLAEAEEALQSELIAADWRVEQRAKAMRGEF